jgi:hypothetical protein
MKIKQHLTKAPDGSLSWAVVGRLEATIETADGLLLCPGCGQDYLHSGQVTVYDRAEDADLAIRTTAAGTKSRVELVKNTRDNPSLRRHGITIQFSCEMCPADPELQIAQHKGQTQISWIFWGEPEPTP